MSVPGGPKTLLVEVAKIHFFRTHCLRVKFDRFCTEKGSPNGTKMINMLSNNNRNQHDIFSWKSSWFFIMSESSTSFKSVINSSKNNYSTRLRYGTFFIHLESPSMSCWKPRSHFSQLWKHANRQSKNISFGKPEKLHFRLIFHT